MDLSAQSARHCGGSSSYLAPRMGARAAAVVEVCFEYALAADLIRKGDVHELKALMTKSNELGMQTYDQALYALYSQGEITYDDAIAFADSPNDLRLMISSVQNRCLAFGYHDAQPKTARLNGAPCTSCEQDDSAARLSLS